MNSSSMLNFPPTSPYFSSMLTLETPEFQSSTRVNEEWRSSGINLLNSTDDNHDDYDGDDNRKIESCMEDDCLYFVVDIDRAVPLVSFSGSSVNEYDSRDRLDK